MILQEAVEYVKRQEYELRILHFITQEFTEFESRLKESEEMIKRDRKEDNSETASDDKRGDTEERDNKTNKNEVFIEKEVNLTYEN